MKGLVMPCHAMDCWLSLDLASVKALGISPRDTLQRVLKKYTNVVLSRSTVDISRM